MRRTCDMLSRTGFYIAVHPWLRAAGYVKVGYTTNLDTRLHMASFKTCFTPEWKFHATFECESAKEALLLEQAVLYCFSDVRVLHRELLRVDETVVARTAAVLTRRLNINAIVGTNSDVIQEQAADESEDIDKESIPEFMPDDEEEKASSAQLSFSTLGPHMEVLLSVKQALTSSSAASHGVGGDALFKDDDDGEYDGDIQYAFLGSFVNSDKETFSATTLRPYQEEAVGRIRAELLEHGKAICQMACRCGKTPVAYHIMRNILTDDKLNGRILYLVPGLALLRQTARKLYGYGLTDVPFVLVGSDGVPVYLGDDGKHSATMTTNEEHIRETVLSHQRLIVISTYHSSPLLAQVNIFALTIFDECHRVCGSASSTNFNTILLSPPHGQRLFLTATPTYDTPIKMDDTNLFGGVAYRYYLREGIDSGFVNPFSVRVVLGTDLSDMRPYFYEVMGMVNKMLVFCRNIEHAEELCKQLRETAFPPDVEPFTILVAHSRMGAGGVSSALGEFVLSRRAILFNVRLFQEGVEIPDLNAVFFAAPRYSSRDIIQSICRPLNRADGKPPSFVFLPAAYNPAKPADDPINLEHFSTLVPFTDALMDEDPTLFEYMIDPQKVAYDLNVVGLRSLKLTTEAVHEFVLPAIRRGVRYSTKNTDRFHRAARMPWKYAFREMRRIVLECGRYPKTNDAWVVGGTSISMSLFYRYVRRGYALYAAGAPTYLQTYQLRDLESLPQWRRYGVHGPYPWHECIRTLRRHLVAHKTPPPLDVHRGGYVGLDATPFERLSGCLMHVNQCDGKQSLRLSPSKQRDMDELCAEYGLKWRKPRDKNGALAPHGRSFITDSYDQFKRLYDCAEKLHAFQRFLKVHFPGYPEKHIRMESLNNLSEGKVPPRHTNMKKNGSAQTRRRSRRSASITRRKRNTRGAEGSTRTVMCRICRTSVEATKWEDHLQSRAHMSAQKALLKARSQ